MVIAACVPSATGCLWVNIFMRLRHVPADSFADSLNNGSKALVG